MNRGIYGEYSVEILNDNNESYYPFGTGFQKNLIVDDFFEKILLGWKHSPQAWIQTCMTNTGNSPAMRTDTTGVFGVPNDITWASTTLITGINIEENKMFMSRDFIFDAVSGNKTYREAMVGLFYENNADIESDIALSHFVFPSDVLLFSGQRLKISYTLNLIIDYLSPTGSPFQLSGYGYNFDGTIKLMSDNRGLFGRTDSTNTYFSYDSAAFLFPRSNNILKALNSNTNNYTVNDSSSNPFTSSFLGGYKPVYTNVGFYGNSFTPSTYPNRYPTATISGSAAQLSTQNLIINDSGASIDVNYYFPPSAFNRNVSGILLANPTYCGNCQNDAAVYLQFNTPQTILANDPISMRINWSFKRL